jgi:hypothetical protein
MKVALPILALLYVISPIDLVPDILLGVGQIDDITVVALLVLFFGRLAKWAPANVVEEYLVRSSHGPTGAPSTSARRRSGPGNVIDADYRLVE